MAEQPSTSKGELADFTLIKSKRGQDLLLRHGYSYNKRRENKNGVIVWRCIQRNECKAQLKTNIDCTVLISENPHLCQPSHIDNESKIKIDKCIKRAKTEPTTSVPKIYSYMVSELQDSGLDLVKKIPNYDTVKKRLYASRNRALQVKKTRFNKVQDLVVPPCYDNLLFADFKDNETRIILFANKKVLNFLKNAENVFCDGTFKSCVPPFLQVYTLHVDVGSTDKKTNILPAIYALLPNKKENTYKTFLNLIKSQLPQFSPKCFTTDFEKSAMLAIEKAFPEARIQGCLFHFKRCLWRKAKQLAMDKSLIHKIHVKRCMALAYLPQEYKIDGWLYVQAENRNEDKI